jgi:hypothetical protein
VTTGCSNTIIGSLTGSAGLCNTVLIGAGSCERIKVDDTGLAINGSAFGISAKAWVNFNGTGTVAIRASFNVTSITDNGDGDYTVNFTNALTDSNYAAVFGGLGSNLGNISGGMVVIAGASNVADTKSTTQLRIQTGSSVTGGLADNGEVNVAIFR